jgi:hypothetical protein
MPEVGSAHRPKDTQSSSGYETSQDTVATPLGGGFRKEGKGRAPEVGISPSEATSWGNERELGRLAVCLKDKHHLLSSMAWKSVLSTGPARVVVRLPMVPSTSCCPESLSCR